VRCAVRSRRVNVYAPVAHQPSVVVALEEVSLTQLRGRAGCAVLLLQHTHTHLLTPLLPTGGGVSGSCTQPLHAANANQQASRPTAPEDACCQLLKMLSLDTWERTNLLSMTALQFALLCRFSEQFAAKRRCFPSLVW
jgi:hypothetical protein